MFNEASVPCVEKYTIAQSLEKIVSRTFHRKDRPHPEGQQNNNHAIEISQGGPKSGCRSPMEPRNNPSSLISDPVAELVEVQTELS